MAGSRKVTVEILGDAKGARRAIRDTDDALGKLSVTGRASAAGLRVVGTGLKGLAVAATATAVVGVGALIGFGKSVVQIGTQYQDSLNSMQAVTHATNAEMQKVAQTSRDLGNDLTLPATSAADAANAMTELAKGNLTADQAMAAAKGTLQLAAAAQIDGATAASIQANALNAFSLQATQAGHVADVLANASNAATGEISDFAYGLQASSAVAAQFNISLDDTVTALAEFANKGIQGSDAGTSLKSALLALASPSKPAAAALEALGLRAFDAQGKFVGLAAISDQLAKAQKRMSQQAFAAAVSTAFGSDAARAAGVFAAYGADGFNKMAAAVGRSGGAAQVAQARMKGLGGAIQGFQSQVETFKIDVFTREAPHLEAFIRLLSDKLPGAADAALRGLDGFTGWVQSEIPAAKAAAQKFGPVVQRYVSDKLTLLGQAATEVAEPALRGVGNILDGLIPKAQSAGEAVDSGLRSGIDAAAKVARQFEADSRGLGASLSDFAGGVGAAAHDALPALQVALTAASTTATVFLDAFTGATRILAPFTSEILLTAGAIKGLQLGVAGVGAARGQIAKISASFGQFADKASFAAGIVTQKVGTALGKDLGTAASAGATAMTGVRAGFSALGAAVIPVTVGLLAVGYANQKMAEEQQHAIESSKAVYDQLRTGGAAAQEAQTGLNAVATQMDHVRTSGAGGAAIAGKMGEALAAGKKASDDAYAALSPLARASEDVAARQSDLAVAVDKYGVNSNAAQVAASAYNAALTSQKYIQDSVADATKTTAQRLAELTDQVNNAASSSLALKSSELAVQQQIAANTGAQEAYNATVLRYKAGSSQAKMAGQALAQSQVALEQQLVSTAQAAARAAEAADKSGDAEHAAEAGARAYKAELIKLGDQLAPGSPVRQYLGGLISQLDSVPTSKHITFYFDTNTTNYRPPPGGPAVAARAGGGPVTKGVPYIVGDGGRPELFVPDEDGTVIPRVPSSTSTGHAGVSGPSRSVLELRSGGSRLDDLLVELIRNAVRVRGGNVQVVLGGR